MFDWFRKKKNNEPEAPAAEEPAGIADAADEEAPSGPEPEQAREDQAAADSPSSGLNETAEPSSPPTEQCSAGATETAPHLRPDDSQNEPPALDQEPAAATGRDESEAAQTKEAETVSDEREQPVKKGFFARFRKKLSSDATPAGDAEKETDGDESPAELPAADGQAPESLQSQAETEASPQNDVEASPAGKDEISAEAPRPDDNEPAAAPEEAAAEEETIEQPPSGSQEQTVSEQGPAPAENGSDEEAEASGKGLFSRFKEKLSATRNQLAGRIENLLSSVRSIDDDLLDELEELLITSDLGIKTTEDLIFKIRGQVASKELNDSEALKQALKKRIREMVSLPTPPRPKVSPMVIMVVGINGVGKTTTIAKLARRFKEEGQKVLLAAGDTFRSAAVDQLVIWSERLGVDIVSQPTGSDASAVVFDALTAAQARGSDVVIIDTAGRLHTKVNLMDELKKIKRVANKALPGAPHHTVLVLDGNTGQNALRQAQTFHEAVGVDSIIVTKLDGTAKGGVIVSICHELKIPIAFVGLGESFEDLQPFDPEAFTEAISNP